MVKVGVVGAAGGIGQPLSLLLKLNNDISQLALYDVVPLVAGVAADLSHINTPAKITHFSGSVPGTMQKALENCQIVVIPAGVPRKPGMTRDDLFNVNAGIIKGIAEAVAEVCPKAFVCIITNPVNSTVPVFCETMQKLGKLDTNRVFGISTLDCLRASTFVAECKGLKPEELSVPVIGGHSGNTILPVLSETGLDFSAEQLEKLTHRIQNAGTEVVEAKAGAGSATLSMAQAGNRFVSNLLKAMRGDHIVECTYVKSDIMPGLDYFASPVVLGEQGIAKFLPLPKLSAFEQKKLDEEVMGELRTNIQTGIDFVNK